MWGFSFPILSLLVVFSLPGGGCLSVSAPTFDLSVSILTMSTYSCRTLWDHCPMDCCPGVTPPLNSVTAFTQGTTRQLVSAFNLPEGLYNVTQLSLGSSGAFWTPSNLETIECKSWGAGAPRPLTPSPPVVPAVAEGATPGKSRVRLLSLGKDFDALTFRASVASPEKGKNMTRTWFFDASASSSNPPLLKIEDWCPDCRPDNMMVAEFPVFIPKALNPVFSSSDFAVPCAQVTQAMPGTDCDNPFGAIYAGNECPSGKMCVPSPVTGTPQCL